MLKVELERWEEIIGNFLGFRKDEQWLQVNLASEIILFFPVSGLEAKIIEERLREVEAGKLVSILRTDLVEKPIIVGMPKEEDKQ